MGSICIQVLEPKELLLRVGQAAHHEYFLIAGVLRSWIGDAQGCEVTLDFSVGPGILTPAIARVFADHSRINCQALTHARLARFDASALVTLMRAVPNAQLWGDAVLRAELMRRVDREWELAALPAAQRLELFQQKFPALDGRVAQHYIASYLGITPVSLSRLKAKIRSKIV
ncbi:MAG: Crp/Fnr family transcriptional regulator [Rhodoferax sp.]|nr:Crp/Fnr family transcriptional regulator [Rhodoferax sp.]